MASHWFCFVFPASFRAFCLRVCLYTMVYLWMEAGIWYAAGVRVWPAISGDVWKSKTEVAPSLRTSWSNADDI